MPELNAKERAEALHEEALTLEEAGETELALQNYEAALLLDGQRSSTCYNLGLIYKYRNQWAESFKYNLRAQELAPGDEAVNWNLAIAATALRDWATVRRIWAHLSLSVGEGSGPIEENFGITPVRLNPDENGEVVWGRRIDPVRVRILNIPFSDSGFRHGDVVLHDGAPVGYREYQGSEKPVFNVLELFQPSFYNTYEMTVHIRDAKDLDDLKRICDDLDIACEDWTSSVRVLCRQCSEGRPHEQHDHEGEQAWRDKHYVAMAAPTDAQIAQAINRWKNEHRSAHSLKCTLRTGVTTNFANASGHRQ